MDFDDWTSTGPVSEADAEGYNLMRAWQARDRARAEKSIQRSQDYGHEYSSGNRRFINTHWEPAFVRPPVAPSEGRLVRGALRRLPLEQQDRYSEEWAADLGEMKGRLDRLLWSLGIWVNGRRVGKSSAAQKPSIL